MRWEDERYVRLYTRDTATWKLLPWQGRALLPLLLRKADRLGLVDVEGDRVEGVAALVDLPPEVVEVGLVGLLARGVVVEASAGLAFPRYLDAQEARASDRLRAQDYRDRKNVTRRDGESRIVTTRHDSSPSVTPRHPPSPAVTPSLAEPSRAGCLPSGDAVGKPPHDDKSAEQRTASGVGHPAPATTPAGDQPKAADGASVAVGDASVKGGGGGSGEQGTLFDEPPANEKSRKSRKTRKASATKAPSEMPFTIGEALDVLVVASKGRFVRGEGRDIAKGIAVGLTGRVKKYPHLDEWKVLGEWLAAGGDLFRETLTPAWATSNSFCGAMVLARDWHAKGRPSLARPSGGPGQQPKPTPESIQANLDRTVPRAPASADPPPRRTRADFYCPPVDPDGMIRQKIGNRIVEVPAVRP